MDEFRRTNQTWWDERARLHASQPNAEYDIAAFRAGADTLKAVEAAELAGEVAGKSLLHLQCHFGLDTLSLARRGAIVTGMDFSATAIETAQQLTADTGLAARFVQSDIYGLPQALAGQFDIVYTSYGVLTWLPDIDGWAQVVSHFLKPGGTFYIVEFHPSAWIWEDRDEDPTPRIGYTYFHRPEPLVLDAPGSYAIGGETEYNRTYEWAHPMGEIVTALLRHGLRLEFLHEFPFTTYRAVPFLQRGADGLWRYPDPEIELPLLFSLKARRDPQ